MFTNYFSHELGEALSSSHFKTAELSGIQPIVQLFWRSEAISSLLSLLFLNLPLPLTSTQPTGSLFNNKCPGILWCAYSFTVFSIKTH